MTVELKKLNPVSEAHIIYLKFPILSLCFNKKTVKGNEIWNGFRSVTLFSLSLKIFIILSGGPEGCYKYITAELKISA